MSARGEGSWSQFRSSVEELHLRDDGESAGASDAEDIADETGLPLYHMLRLNLQRLGHAEFGAGAEDNDWRVTPPCLAVTAQPFGWRGVLTGARSRELLARIVRNGESAGVEQLPSLACPDVIRFEATDSGILSKLAELSGLHLQSHAPATLLMSIPPIDDRSMLRIVSVPFGRDWRIERFSVQSLTWKTATHEEAQLCTFGLFRFSLYHQRQVLFCSKGTVFEVPIQVGKYMLLRRRHRRTLRYDKKAREISVPISCRPPFLVERALILCSGMVPSYGAGNGKLATVHYSDVPDEVAQLAAAVLRQELQ
jgi:hypothetical protein